MHVWRGSLHLPNCLRPNVGVPEDGRDLAAEAAAEGLPGGRQPQAGRDRRPQGFAEGEGGEDGAAGEAEQGPRRQAALSHHRGRGQSASAAPRRNVLHKGN